MLSPFSCYCHREVFYHKIVVNAIFISHFFVGRVVYGYMPHKSGLVDQREVDIGRRVQQVREYINWPQPAFAAELEISRDRLASVEYGRTPLRYPVGYRLCVIFDINPEWLANGTGNIKSEQVLPDLPTPEGLPPKAMYSRIYDQSASGKPVAGKKPTRRQSADEELIPDFDATTYIVRGLTDLLSKEKFRSPLERQEFALEITSYARDLALRLRRDNTRDRALAVSSRRGGLSTKPADLTGVPARNAKMVVQLREGIKRLEQEIDKLDAAMKSLNPVAIDPSRLPRPDSMEVVRLEGAMDKIAQQIEEAERKIKAVMSKRYRPLLSSRFIPHGSRHGRSAPASGLPENSWAKFSYRTFYWRNWPDGKSSNKRARSWRRAACCLPSGSRPICAAPCRKVPPLFARGWSSAAHRTRTIFAPAATPGNGG